jgi:endonuclease/exonuclease/phosphatase family metal-dependent hydrolase
MKIASWNIAGGHPVRSNEKFDYGEANIDYFTSRLKKVNADVICLQESQIGSMGDISSQIAQSLGFANVYQHTLSNSHIDKGQSLGIAVLSKNPCKSERLINYPQPDFDLVFKDGEFAEKYQKGMQLLEFDNLFLANTQLLPLHIFNYSYENGEGNKLASSIDNIFYYELKQPLIFTGDFNMDSPQTTFSRSFRKFDLKEGLPDKDSRPRTGHNWPRSDHIFYSANSFSIKDSGIVTAQTDHYLCWASIEPRF